MAIFLFVAFVVGFVILQEWRGLKFIIWSNYLIRLFNNKIKIWMKTKTKKSAS
jgi:hypothetical protein